MDLKLPTSMTALINIRFHYDESNKSLSGEVELQLLDELMEKAENLAPELQDILLKFASTLNKNKKESETNKES